MKPRGLLRSSSVEDTARTKDETNDKYEREKFEKYEKAKENEKLSVVKSVFPSKCSNIFTPANTVVPLRQFSSSSATRDNGINENGKTEINRNENGKEMVRNDSNSKDVDMLQSKLEFIQIDGQLIKKKIQGMLSNNVPKRISTPAWDHDTNQNNIQNNQNNYYALPPTQGAICSSFNRTNIPIVLHSV